MNPLPHLNIVGAGRLGRTLARLWREAGMLHIGAVYSRAPASRRSAIEFIGGGKPCTHVADLPPATMTLIAVPDAAIAGVAIGLADAIPDWRDQLVFHCSGLHSSQLLAPLAARGAAVASAHPLHSFADPIRSLGTFTGTVCALEGDSAAVATLSALFEGIAATTVVIEADAKPLYHAAAAMASNYLVALLDSSAALLASAGIAPTLTTAMLEPLVRQTTDNVFARGADHALTGPIARGDWTTVAAHLRAIEDRQPALLPLYRALGVATLAIAERQGMDSTAREQLRQLLIGVAGHP
jgi:predicted short-subunit dehydrogenase-like oxidoreductase (DUF2520 family)